MTAFRQIGIVALAAVSIAACATRRPETQIPEAPHSIVPVWRLETGDLITTKIYREPDLSSQTTVSQNGEGYFPGIGRVKVSGLTLDSLQLDLTARYDKLVIDAAVDAVMMRDVIIYGQIRSPGVYSVDPSLTVLGLVAKAGGATGSGKTALLTLVKGDGRQYRLTREVRLSALDIVHGDAIFVQDESFLGRNSATFGSVALISTVALSVVSLLILFLK